jgi:hypothetical protein
LTNPVRLQLSRRKGFDLQEHSRSVNGLEAISVARQGKWGNPYRVGIGGWSAQNCVDAHRREIVKNARSMSQLTELKGKNLACFCALDEPCHGDTLLELANK